LSVSLAAESKLTQLDDRERSVRTINPGINGHLGSKPSTISMNCS
jgi:hypothetical protein